MLWEKAIFYLIFAGTSNRKSEIEKKVGKAQLINKLNFVNFQDGAILINLKHGQYDKEISLKADTPALQSAILSNVCGWMTKTSDKIIQSYEFRQSFHPQRSKTAESRA